MLLRSLVCWRLKSDGQRVVSDKCRPGAWRKHAADLMEIPGSHWTLDRVASVGRACWQQPPLTKQTFPLSEGWAEIPRDAFRTNRLLRLVKALNGADSISIRRSWPQTPYFGALVNISHPRPAQLEAQLCATRLSPGPSDLTRQNVSMRKRACDSCYQRKAGPSQFYSRLARRNQSDPLWACRSNAMPPLRGATGAAITTSPAPSTAPSPPGGGERRRSVLHFNLINPGGCACDQSVRHD
jgi:hypothetical protein